MRWPQMLTAFVFQILVITPGSGGTSGLAAAAGAATSTHAASLAERGRYLATAANCEGCHTAPGGQPFAGGNSIATPFGNIRSPNLTPDNSTGLGLWREDEFVRAMRDGIGRDGQHLYPAFPYPWYRRMTRGDLLAIRAYLRTLPPVRNAVKRRELPFPYERSNMLLWNALFLNSSEIQPVAGKSKAWNRGAYLVEGPGHCGVCHTPKNTLGADATGDEYRGATLPGKQRVPSLRCEGRRGMCRWTAAEIAEYLKTGSNHHKAAAGQMAVVITQSTSQLNDADLLAMAVYLKDLPVPDAEDRGPPYRRR
jgi:mono/diheme cytochrome c family protein